MAAREAQAVAKLVCVARIGAPHGVRGEVRLFPFTAEPMAVARYGVLTSADSAVRVEIEALRPGRGFLVARLRGVADRESAEKLRNLELYVPRERLPEVEDEDTFYHADLIGLTVETADGTRLGTVVAVHDFGAGDLIEINVGSGRSVLMPFTKAAVPLVDLAGGRIVADPPPGTFD